MARLGGWSLEQGERTHGEMPGGLGLSAPPGSPILRQEQRKLPSSFDDGRGGGVHPSPRLVEAGKATQLSAEQMNCGSWEVRKREAEAASWSEEGTCSWCGLLRMAGRHGWADEGEEHSGGGPEPLPHANMVSCSHLNRSKVTTPSRSVSRVLKNRNMVSSRTRQHTKLSKSTARSGSE